MSCIVGVVNKNGVWIGADGLATTEDGQRRPIVADKIIRNKGYLLGYAGSVRAGQLMDPHHFSPPKNILDFADSLLHLLEEKGSVAKTTEELLLLPINILVGYKKKLYEILADFQLNEVVDFSSIGTGAPYAYGSLFETSHNPNLKTEDRVMRALKAGQCFDRSTGEPFEVKKL
jgi:ATP-dependent protease HslVU (ClpYQ) peptidase subunit